MDLTSINIAAAVGLAWIGSLEWRLMRIRTESEKLIDLKQQGLIVTQKEFRHDIRKLETKIDEVLKLLISERK